MTAALDTDATDTFGFSIDLSGRWLQINPTLGENELVLERDTGRWKLGDGGTTYGSLNYLDQLLGLGGGAGNGTLPTPGAPDGVTLSATAYPASSTSNASYCDITASIAPPDNNTDGTAITDIAGYEYSYCEVNPAPSPLATPDPADPRWTAPLPVGVLGGAGAYTSSVQTITKRVSGDQITVRARVVNSQGTRSDWTYSAPLFIPYYTNLPATPSLPVVDSYLGVLRARWDGLDSTGQPMFGSGAFDHVEVHWSTDPGFVPSAATRTDSLDGAGSSFLTTADYGLTYYCRFLAVSRVGNTSAATAAVAGTPGQVVSDDLFAGCVGSEQLAYEAVKTANIDSLAVNDAEIGSVSVGKLTAGVISAQVTVSGRIATALTGTRVEFDGTGIHLRDSSGNVVCEISTTNGALISGAQITGSSFATAAGSSGMAITLGPNSVFGNWPSDAITWVGSSLGVPPCISLTKLGTSGDYAMLIQGPGKGSNAADAPYIGMYTDGNAVAINAPGGTSIGGGGNTEITGFLTVDQSLTVGDYTPGSSGNITAFGAVSSGQGAATLQSGGSINGASLAVTGAITAGASITAGTTLFAGNNDTTAARNIAMNNAGTIGISSDRSGTSQHLVFVSGSTNAGYITTGGNMTINGTLTQSSSAKHKHDVQDLPVTPGMVDALRMVTYHSTHTADEYDRAQYGVIAEELLEHPELALFVEHDTAGQPCAVDYTKLTLAAVLSVNAKLEQLTKAGA